jgi:ribulose-phosphate 3-epimerase
VTGPLVAASVLAADFGDLRGSVRGAAEAGADWIHWDVMDGRFVPVITFGPEAVRACRGAADLPFDVHLMVEEPGPQIDDFVAAGADLVTLHVESRGDIAGMLARVRSAGRKAGVTLRPGTPLDALAPHLANVDLVLVMSVEPGRGGQAYLADATDRIRDLADRRRRAGATWKISVDGGIDPQTARAARAAGADVLVAGTSVFGAADVTAAIRALR